MSEQLKGTIKWFNAAKGYGFILPEAPRADGKSGDIFVHHSNINMPGYRTLVEGQEVTFEMGDGKGGFQAINVVPAKTDTNV
jgi:CspA family cold shock protein